MPDACTYKTPEVSVPGWMAGAFADMPLGYSYETSDFFVHLFGVDSGFWMR